MQTLVIGFLLGSFCLVTASHRVDSDPFAGDERLLKKESIKAMGIPLKELLEQLTKETGIQLVAGSKVAEDKIVLFAHDRPLVDSLRMIAKFFNFYWGRTGHPAVYTLSQSLKQQRKEEIEVAESYVAAARQIVKDARQLQEFADMPPDQLKTLHDLARAELESTSDLARREELFARLSALNQVQALSYLPQIASLLANEGPDRIVGVLQGDLLRFDSPPNSSTNPLDPTMSERIFQGFRAARGPGQEERSYNVASVKFIGVESGSPMVQVQVNAGVRTDSSFNMSGRGLMLPLTAPANSEQVPVEPVEWKANSILARSASLSFRFDPRVVEPGPIVLPPPAFARAITKLQESRPFDFISGAFHSTNGPYLEIAARPVGEILTSIARNTMHRWTFEDAFVQMKAQGYAKHRANEPPVFTLRRWALLDDAALYSLDRLAEIMAQTPPRVDVTLGVLREYRGMESAHELRNSRDLFVLWNALSRNQRAAALSSGLPYGSLNARVQALYQMAVSNPRNPLDQIPQSRSRLAPGQLIGSVLKVTRGTIQMWGRRTATSTSTSGGSRERVLADMRENEPGFQEKDLRAVSRETYHFRYSIPSVEPITIRVELPASWSKPTAL